jgi:hypothetical protein
MSNCGLAVIISESCFVDIAYTSLVLVPVTDGYQFCINCSKCLKVDVLLSANDLMGVIGLLRWSLFRSSVLVG